VLAETAYRLLRAFVQAIVSFRILHAKFPAMILTVLHLDLRDFQAMARSADNSEVTPELRSKDFTTVKLCGRYVVYGFRLCVDTNHK
jgi:hypothetical protein